jgi:hypothetical protein
MPLFLLLVLFGHAGATALALDIFVQPIASSVIDPDPFRKGAGNINDEQLVFGSYKRF